MNGSRALLLLGAWSVAGCISLAELRGRTPTRVGEVAGRYRPLAACVTAKAEQDPSSQGVSYDVQDIAAVKTARVVATAQFPGGLFYAVPTPLVELTFREPDEGNVKIEARRGPLGSALELTMWPIIEICAGRTVVVSPRL
jgi:hypothetical protein